MTEIEVIKMSEGVERSRDGGELIMREVQAVEARERAQR